MQIARAFQVRESNRLFSPVHNLVAELREEKVRVLIERGGRMQTMSETIEIQSPICNHSSLICPFEPMGKGLGYYSQVFLYFHNVRWWFRVEDGFKILSLSRRREVNIFGFDGWNSRCQSPVNQIDEKIDFVPPCMIPTPCKLSRASATVRTMR